MSTESPSRAPLSKSRGVPGAAVRSRGFAQALSPFIGIVFGAGWVFGAVVSPAFLQGKHAGLLLIFLAVGLYITWRRAVNLLLRHEEGARGEEQVARVLEGLPEGWRIFHGVRFGEKVMDHVLVGPDHVYTIETVNWPGQVELINHKLVHDGRAYPGYELQSLRDRSASVAEDLGVSSDAVSPLVCIVGGRFGEKAGEKEGVWVGEIQEIGTYLMQPYGNPLDRTIRVSVLEALENRLEETSS